MSSGISLETYGNRDGRWRPRIAGRRQGEAAAAPMIESSTAAPLASNTTSASPAGESPRLVLTSPPYPGVHVLYHRWQVDGRKEAPLPFMIANKLDGAVSSYYTMGDRKYPELKTYFDNIRATMSSVAALAIRTRSSCRWSRSRNRSGNCRAISKRWRKPACRRCSCRRSRASATGVYGGACPVGAGTATNGADTRQPRGRADPPKEGGP